MNPTTKHINNSDQGTPRIPWLPLFPITFFLLIMLGGTVIFMLALSLGYAPIYGIQQFPTLDYYLLVWNRPGFYLSVGLTIYYATASTVIALVLALILAPMLLKPFRGIKTFNLIYKYPLMVPYLVGIAMVILLFSSGGLLARISYALGWIQKPSDFPDLLYSYGGWGIIWVYVWKQLPFITLSLYAVLIRLDTSVNDAAKLLGANRLQRLWHIQLPLLAPAIVSATLICFAFNFGAFEAPLILGGGFPETLPVRAWRLFVDPDFHNRLEGMATLVLIGVLLLIPFKLSAIISTKYTHKSDPLIQP